MVYGAEASQKNEGGKIIPTKPPSQSTQQHLSQIASILHSPKKRASDQGLPSTSTHNTKHHYVIATNRSNPSTLNPNPPVPTPTPTLQDHQMLTQIDRRFSLIEDTIHKHQEYNKNFHLRLLSLEKTTTNTDSKIDMILNKMETIANPSKQRKVSFNPDLTNNDCEMIENIHPNSQHQSRNTGCNDQCF